MGHLFDAILFRVSNMIYRKQRWCVFFLVCNWVIVQPGFSSGQPLDDVCDEDDTVWLFNIAMVQMVHRNRWFTY